MCIRDRIEIINKVVELFKSKSVTEISNLSHDEKAWIETKDMELISYEYSNELKII